jgi:hypothetical protein
MPPSALHATKHEATHYRHQANNIRFLINPPTLTGVPHGHQHREKKEKRKNVGLQDFLDRCYKCFDCTKR